MLFNWTFSINPDQPGGGGGASSAPLEIVRDKSAARIALSLAARFMSFFLIVSRIFGDQTCDVRVYGYKVT